MNQTIKSTLSVVLGNFIYALTVTLFLIPAGLVTGGTTGIALTMNNIWNIPLSSFILTFNILMLVIGYCFLGKIFAITTLTSTFLYPIFLKICELIFGNLILTQDLLICTVFSGLGIGIALGIVIRSGASTGGMDIPPLVLNKLFKIPVSTSMYVFDFFILLMQLLFRPFENVLYGILLVIIYTIVLDKILIIGTNKIELKIISKKHQELSNVILKQIDRGVTLINSEGAYTHEETKLVLSIVSNRELVKVERLVRQIDPECFVIISRVIEVSGRGFSLQKQHK